MSFLHRVCSVTLLVVSIAAPAWAQSSVSPPDRGDWTHGSVLALAGGVATGSSDTGAIAGGAIGWEITPRVMVEGSGLWLDRDNGADGFNAAVKVRAGLKRAGVSPFAEAGVGLYHVSTNGSDAMPEFYRRRMTTDSGGMTTQSFTDPSFHVGAGVNVFVSRHVALQPAAEMLVVARDSQTFTVAAFACRVAYHFEDHPVTR
jgi:hypothetical protein